MKFEMQNENKSRAKKRKVIIRREVKPFYPTQEGNIKKPLPSSEVSPFMRNQAMHKVETPRTFKDIIAWLLLFFPF
ncbi:MAG: hypothetical protein KGD65_03285 [Candidatus Lokiarchaeota archaeon]|nr:hypothetical protein [Candidatus Lokiarchaeota archaeon]